MAERKRHAKRKPGYDCGRAGEKCQHEKKGNHGIADETWHYAVSDGRHAVSLAVSSSSYPTSVTDLPAILRRGPSGIALCTHQACGDEHPWALDCDYVEGGRCVGDCGYLNGTEFFAAHGLPQFEQPEAFWKALEARLDEEMARAREAG